MISIFFQFSAFVRVHVSCTEQLAEKKCKTKEKKEKKQKAN
jgi:hypothetical protein